MVTRKSDQSKERHKASSPRLRLHLHQLEVFVAIARAGSTHAAADRVARSQSAASSALAELELALGASLFDRSARRLVLNENGRALLPKAQSLLDQSTELQSLFSGEHAAPLRVAASFTIGEYLLPERVASWSGLHPGSPVHMQIANTHDVIAAVADFDADIGFVEGPQAHPMLRILPWLADELVIIAAPGHALSGAASVGKRQLAGASWVLREQGSGTRQVTDNWLQQQLGGAANIALELGSTEAIKRVVAAGDSLGFLSRHAVAQDLEDGRLVALHTRLPRASRQLAVTVHRDKRLGRVAQDFLGHCRVTGAMSE